MKPMAIMHTRLSLNQPCLHIHPNLLVGFLNPIQTLDLLQLSLKNIGSLPPLVVLLKKSLPAYPKFLAFGLSLL